MMDDTLEAMDLQDDHVLNFRSSTPWHRFLNCHRAHSHALRHKEYSPIEGYFTLKRNCVGLLGFCFLPKYTAPIRMLAYGSPIDVTDEYIRMGERTCLEALVRFSMVVVNILGKSI